LLLIFFVLDSSVSSSSTDENATPDDVEDDLMPASVTT
jgi:hypothetical protein